MTIIPPFAAGSYNASRNTSQLLALKSQLNDLTNQLSSGLTAQTYGGLGSAHDRPVGPGLDQRPQRLQFGDRHRADPREARHDQPVPGGHRRLRDEHDVAERFAEHVDGYAGRKSTALNNLNAALDALNQSDGSVYLFGGKKGSTQPVLDAGTILYGTSNANGAVDGLQTIVQDQVLADVGPNGDGA